MFLIVALFVVIVSVYADTLTCGVNAFDGANPIVLSVPSGSAPQQLVHSQLMKWTSTGLPATGQFIRQFLTPGGNTPNANIVFPSETTDSGGYATFTLNYQGAVVGQHQYGLAYYTYATFIDVSGKTATTDVFICDTYVTITVT